MGTTSESGSAASLIPVSAHSRYTSSSVIAQAKTSFRLPETASGTVSGIAIGCCIDPTARGQDTVGRDARSDPHSLGLHQAGKQLAPEGSETAREGSQAASEQQLQPAPLLALLNGNRD